MTNTKLKIALLGVSHWHVPLYLPGLPENSVVAVSDDNESITNKFARKYNCPAYRDYRQMITDTRPDFVFAFAPHHRMKEVAEYLLEENIPFSIEKPAGLNAGEVEALYDYAEKKGAFCAIPFVWRYSDTVNDLKSKYLTSNIVHMSYKFVAGPPSRYIESSPWMLSQKTAGGGCMTNLGVHFIDMALYGVEIGIRLDNRVLIHGLWQDDVLGVEGGYCLCGEYSSLRGGWRCGWIPIIHAWPKRFAMKLATSTPLYSGENQRGSSSHLTCSIRGAAETAARCHGGKDGLQAGLLQSHFRHH